MLYAGPEFLPTDRHDTYPVIDPTKADLSGKVVVVTGASKGIGRAIAMAMAQAGAKGLALLARSDLDHTKERCLAAQRPGHPLKVLTIQVDVANNDQVVAAARQVEETFGRVDVVINNAGMWRAVSQSIASSPRMTAAVAAALACRAVGPAQVICAHRVSAGRPVRGSMM